MKNSLYYIMVVSFFVFVACKANKIHLNSFKKTECPYLASCNTSLSLNKSLLIQEEKLTQLPYPQIVEGESMVIHFTYEKVSPDGISDGGLTETLFFEIPQNTDYLHLKDQELQSIKLLWGQHCFCPDAGYFPVSIGEALIEKHKDTLYFEIQFKIEGIHPVVSRVSEKIEIK